MFGSITKSWCNLCGHETDHDVVWREKISSDDNTFDGIALDSWALAVRCRGCGQNHFRRELWEYDLLSGDINDEPKAKLVSVDYEPARLWHRSPEWLESLEERDPDLKGLLDEVYSATNHRQVRLLSMGVRAVLDRVMTLILGDIGGFEQKLGAMVDHGHLTSRQRDDIAVVIDAGSASTHRGFKPDRELIKEMVVVMENLVRAHYITGPMLQTAKLLIPPRPRAGPLPR